jgi:DNA-binding GntR family transcriptional regulator
VLVAASGNRALSAVLDQFQPVVRRSERLRFGSGDARASVERHERFITLCARRDIAAAAALTFDTWHSLNPGAPGNTEG